MINLWGGRLVSSKLKNLLRLPTKCQGKEQELAGCLELEMPNDKSTLTPNHLPVQVCGVIYYKKTGNIRCKLCSKDGILKGTCGREQLSPAPQHTAHGLGIFYQWLDRKKTITMTEAGEKYCLAGGKLSYCHCKKDCSLSKTYRRCIRNSFALNWVFFWRKDLKNSFGSEAGKSYGGGAEAFKIIFFLWVSNQLKPGSSSSFSFIERVKVLSTDSWIFNIVLIRCSSVLDILLEKAWVSDGWWSSELNLLFDDLDVLIPIDA